MNFTTMIILPILGFLIGLFVTIIGGGGGGLYTPILIMLGIDPQVAVASSLATVLPTTAVGAYNHNKNNNVDIETGIILGVGGFIGTFIGGYIGTLIGAKLLKILFGVIFLTLALINLKNYIKEQRSKEKIEKKSHVKLTGYKKIFVPLFGVLGGILAGLFGLSGTPPIQLVLLMLGYNATTVIGTTIFVLIFNSIGGICTYGFLGRIDLMLVVLLCSGTIIGAVIGPKVLNRINKEKLEKALPLILISLNLIFGVAMFI